jgi:twitching motility protein PilT
MKESSVVKLEDVLRLAVEMNASDIHVQVGLPPMFRVRGKLVTHESDALTAEQCEALIFSIMLEDQKKTFGERLDFDFSYGVPGLARFRVNTFRQRGSVAAAFRPISYQIPAVEQLGLPLGVLDLVKLKRGFVLVTGATGQGKSTTLASLLDRMNQERQLHIVTLEDPVEYLFQHKASIVVQREVGIDTLSFASALRASLREDPDVILVGEMRDLPTIETAMTAAETGHLVFATLHTKTPAQGIDRIVDVFPPHQQQQVRVQLANVLHAVVTQQLIPRRDSEGIALATEMLMVSSAIRNLIREGKTFQIQSVLQTGASSGMLTMENSLKGLVEKGWISADDAIEHCFDPKEMARILGRR